MLKKIVILFIFISFLVGCDSNSNIKTDVVSIIEQNDRITVSMHYPITSISDFDKIIKKYIENTYQSFSTEYGSYLKLGYQPELNIDYTYQEVDGRYLNITLKTFIQSGTLAHPIFKIQTFVYDKKNFKLLQLKDFIDENTLKKMVPVIKQQLISNYKECLFIESLSSKINKDFSNYSLFTVQNNNITFYFNPYEISSLNCGIIKIDIPINKYSLLLPVSSNQNNNTFYKYTSISNVIDPNKPVIALTFDDGPSKYTKEIVEVLKEYNAVATFFVLGNKVELYSDTLQVLLNNGNEIGNHSYNHKWLTKLSNDDFQKQLNDTNKLVYDMFNYQIKSMRPTYGAINQKLREQSNLDVVMWDIDTRDWSYKDSKRIANIAINEAEDGKIILMHDTRKRTLEAVKILVPALIEKGYQFVTVQELKETQAIRKQQKSYE